MDSYLTIESPSRGEYREKGSKFYAFAYPVSSEEDINRNLEQLGNEFHDARHICYAWKMGDSFKAQDAGEPNHSAGDPILNQIRSFGVDNVLLVVVRYFGGTKLGKSGLINAYKTAANEALENSVKIESFITEDLEISFPYDKTSEVMRYIEQDGVQIKDQKFAEKTNFKLSVRKSIAGELKAALKDFLK